MKEAVGALGVAATSTSRVRSSFSIPDRLGVVEATEHKRLVDCVYGELRVLMFWRVLQILGVGAGRKIPVVRL